MGANTGFFITEKSITAIDAKMDRDSSEKSIEEIKTIYNIIDEEPSPGMPRFPWLVETLYNEIKQ